MALVDILYIEYETQDDNIPASSEECPGRTRTTKITLDQRDRRQRALLQHQNFDFLFYLGWSGCFIQSKHIIMKVVQS